MNPLLPLALFVPLAVLPQQGGRFDNRISTSQVRFDLGALTAGDDVIKLNRRSRIAVRPVDLRDRAGRALADTELVALPNGKQITAAAYKKELEPLQQALSEAGYSLNDRQKVILREPSEGAAVLEGQTRALRAELKPGARPLGAQSAVRVQSISIGEQGAIQAPVFQNLMLNLDAVQGAPSGSGRLGGGRLRGPAAPEPTEPVNRPINIRKEFYKGFGNKTFGAGFGADLTVSGRVQGNDKNALNLRELNGEFHLAVNGRATGRVVGKECDLVRFTGNYDADNKSKTVHIAGGVFVAGQKVWSDDTTVPQGPREKNVEKSVQASASASFPIVGPISISAEVGMRGKVGVTYKYDLKSSSVNGEILPYADVSGYAQGGIAVGPGSGVLGVAVRGTVNLIKYNGELGANVGVGLRGGTKISGADVVLFERAYWYNSLELLSGRLDLILIVPLFEDATVKLFDWSGFKADGYLLNNDAQQVIGQTEPLVKVFTQPIKLNGR